MLLVVITKNSVPWMSFTMNKGVKFLKTLWCCFGGRAYKGNLVLSTELIT